jgi:hypothetical protein
MELMTMAKERDAEAATTIMRVVRNRERSLEAGMDDHVTRRVKIESAREGGGFA